MNKETDKAANISEFKQVNQNFFSSLILNIKLILPKRCRFGCCKETTKDRLFNRGYKKLKKEIEIQNILKKIRVLVAATKKTFTRAEWDKFKVYNESRYLHLTDKTHYDKYKKDPKVSRAVDS